MEPESLRCQRRHSLQSSVAHLVCTACCTLEQTKILAKPFRFLHLSRIALMILVFLLLSACAACHTCEDPAFERITSTTIIEKKEVGFSGLLVILENSVRNLAEKQANMTSGMNHSIITRIPRIQRILQLEMMHTITLRRSS